VGSPKWPPFWPLKSPFSRDRRYGPKVITFAVQDIWFWLVLTVLTKGVKKGVKPTPQKWPPFLEWGQNGIRYTEWPMFLEILRISETSDYFGLFYGRRVVQLFWAALFILFSLCCISVIMVIWRSMILGGFCHFFRNLLFFLELSQKVSKKWWFWDLCINGRKKHDFWVKIMVLEAIWPLKWPFLDPFWDPYDRYM
jgi:hypothetical protein